MWKHKLIIILVLFVTVVVFGLYSSKHPVAPVALVPVPGDDAQQVLKLTDGRQCYTYSHEATTDEPYNVSEFIDITINGTLVSGTKHGTQAGPDMTNGYEGTILGTLDDNKITDVYSYTVEGSHNQEKEIYQAGLTGIEKLRYPLMQYGGMLVPDTTKDFTTMLYARVGCEASN
ncbi:MAG: hypothetical protein V4486_03560 [Patescibacteria group bacterium]